ncbi:MAG: hypothetical protein AAF773_29910, partial [Cyanobacteria bacterium P01_D01_bin.115]
QWFGRQDLQGLRRAGLISIVTTIGVTTVVAIVLLLFRQPIIGLYIDISDPENAALVKLGTSQEIKYQLSRSNQDVPFWQGF